MCCLCPSQGWRGCGAAGASWAGKWGWCTEGQVSGSLAERSGSSGSTAQAAEAAATGTMSWVLRGAADSVWGPCGWCWEGCCGLGVVCDRPRIAGCFSCVGSGLVSAGDTVGTAWPVLCRVGFGGLVVHKEFATVCVLLQLGETGCMPCL